MVLPSDPLDMHVVVLCGGNACRRDTMKSRLKYFRNVTWFDNEGFSCTEGHLRILKEVLHGDGSGVDDYVCIFEDDACLYECFFDVYNNVFEYLNASAEWDMFFFGANILKPPMRVTDFIMKAQPSSVYTTHAYIIHKRAFVKALSLLQKKKDIWVVDDIYTRSDMVLYLSRYLAVTQLPPDDNVEHNMLVHTILVDGYKTHVK